MLFPTRKYPVWTTVCDGHLHWCATTCLCVSLRSAGLKLQSNLMTSADVGQSHAGNRMSDTLVRRSVRRTCCRLY